MMFRTMTTQGMAIALYKNKIYFIEINPDTSQKFFLARDYERTTILLLRHLSFDFLSQKIKYSSKEKL